MIQRIQSIWLLLAALTILSLFFIPTLSGSSGDTNYVLYGYGLKSFPNTTVTSSAYSELLLSGMKVPATGITQTNNIPLLISVLLSGLISLVNIFNFKNRKLQIRISYLNIILILGLSFLLSRIITNVSGLTAINIEIGIAVPFIAVIFSFLAIRGIKNDEKLIKSADRLR